MTGGQKPTVPANAPFTRRMVRRTILFLLAALFFASCLRTETTFVADVNPLSWGPAQPVEVVRGNLDTTGLYDLVLVVGYDASAPAAEIPLTITTTAPDSSLVSEIVRLRIDKDGMKSSHPGECKQRYRYKALFSQSGDYTFAFVPGHEVSGIRWVGLMFDKK